MPGDRGAYDAGARRGSPAQNIGRRDTRRALASLDMTAIAAVQDNGAGGPLVKVIVTGDPDAQLRLYRSMNPRVVGLALVLWTDNEVVGRRIAEATRRALEAAGHGREGGWLGSTAGHVDAVLRRVAGEMGARLHTDTERLRMITEGLR